MYVCTKRSRQGIGFINNLAFVLWREGGHGKYVLWPEMRVRLSELSGY